MTTPIRLQAAKLATVAALLTMAACWTGCSNDAPRGTTQTGEKAQPPADDHGHGDHGHGPHDGQILDLGHGHKYHAELVEDTANKAISIYILDGKLKEHPIDPKPLTLVLMLKGEATAVEIAAVGEGETAHFSSQDESILDAMHAQDGDGKLRVTIDGTPFSATIAKHDHEH